jgi:hypothetical protein
VKDHGTSPHPGPFRIPKLAGEFDAVMIAVGFIALGLAGLPIAKFFLLGAILFGAIVALLFRFFRRKPLFPNRFF